MNSEIYGIDYDNDRVNRLQSVIEFYCENFVEDPINGTRFDCDVLDSLAEFQRKATRGYYD